MLNLKVLEDLKLKDIWKREGIRPGIGRFAIIVGRRLLRKDLGLRASLLRREGLWNYLGLLNQYPWFN